MDEVVASVQPMPASEPAMLIRTLVVGTDAAFGDRAATVIGELGEVACAVAAPTDPSDVWWLVQHERADVVVLDATGCETGVTRVIAALADVAPRLGVVVVCEHLTPAAQALHALPKWGWTSALRASVERARSDGNPLVRPRTLSTIAARHDGRGLTPAPIPAR